jgi:2-polyprenyl-6-methoxyphenol hydroxylase-like FAD-dependent oxidoreductase
MAESQHDVVIVGAGPTGLTLAAELWRLGLRPLLLERETSRPVTSRAIAIHARTLEVLEDLGATQPLLSEGLRLLGFQMREHDRTLMRIHFDGLKTRYPFVLSCPQNRTEEILRARLEAFGGSVHTGCTVTGVTTGGPEGDSIEVRFTRTGGSTETVRAGWVVACDGQHSLVRQAAAIPYEGSDYEESFVLADVVLEWEETHPEGSMFLAEQGILLLAPLPGQHFRIIAVMDPAPEQPSLEDLQRLLDERGSRQHRATVRSVTWSSRFRIHHYLAATLRKGRVLLAGDAAHVHSPAGGQGMNTGIQDAVSLAPALRETLRNGDDAPLDAWANERRQIARSVVRMTDQLTRIATVSSASGKILRSAMFLLLGHTPGVEHALAEKLSELDNR